MREYEVLFRYLKSSNWNEDGTPSDDDDYYMIGKVKVESKEQVKKWADEGNHYAMRSIGKCKEISDLFPRRQSEDVQVYLHHPSAPARVKYPAPWGELAREKLSHAPLLCCGVFDFAQKTM